MKLKLLLFAIVPVAIWAWQGHDDLAGYPSLSFDHPAIRYMDVDPTGAVAKLNAALAKGAVKLDYQPGPGYLLSVLKALNVPVDSQVLVYSKTSFQPRRITPRNPRAIFFNDEISVGWVPGNDEFEVMALDPVLGYVFYTMDTAKMAKPELYRRGLDCLQCHIGPATMSVPGLMVSSATVRPDGTRSGTVPNVLTDQRVPLANRWGGWYVTGTHGAQVHNGNAFAMDPSAPAKLDRSHSLNVTSLADRADLSPHLAKTSDLVALMTLEHQSTMTNLLLRLGWEARMGAQEKKNVSARLDEIVADVVSYMTYANEVQLSEAVAGTSTFSKNFAARGPRDKQGRSLREFDLTKRLFRYPLSYMIYTQAFDGLPAVAKERMYRKLYDALTSPTPLARFSNEERRAAVEIVRETKTGVPEFWK